MRAFHDSRQADYRSPFGAAPVGTDVTVSIDIWDDPGASCVCRLWTDGKGETLIPMERREREDFLRFTCVIHTGSPDIIWYSFILHGSDGGVCRYGARDGRVGGEGQLCDWEPPSFQITAYRPRPLPEWYKNAVVYQIFPDRYCRGEDWRALAGAALENQERKGPARRLCEDWDRPPFYEKDENGRVVAWDFYGGTLSGIREKLGHLRAMGITALYLNPIFEAASNHRYDTGDYTKVDALLGDEKAFRDLAEAAEREGISLILDGVFNHTGCDSRYFNKYGNYDTVGAYQSEASPYRDWYRFDDSPAGYDCWWGVDDLPNLEETAPGYQSLIYGDRDSVVRKWLRAGAKGWRLDVADELPDEFIAHIKTAVTDTLGDDGLLIGEVWEDASHKISYDKLRRYLLGEELDGVMNYPLREGVHGFLLGTLTAEDLKETLTALQENYPRQALYGGLNLMGSHDRARIMTLMGEAPDPKTLTEEEKRDYRLPEDRRDLAKRRIWLMTLLQMTLPGVPCVYYGDEAGAEGYADPYNRGTFPWGKEDPDLETIYRNAIALRKHCPVFTGGDFTPLAWGEDVFGFLREDGKDACAVLVNRSLSQSHTVAIPARGRTATDLVNGSPVTVKEDGTAAFTLWPMGSAVISFRDGPGLGAVMPRGAGVLCHITSLPNEKGPGNIGEPAKRFIEFLAASGQKYWQILPLNPTDEHGSPYAGASAFAANPALLPESEEELRQAFRTFAGGPDYEAFCERNRDWLEPYALFTALRKKHKYKAWRDWPKTDRAYPPRSARYKTVQAEAAFHRFCQYRFHLLWSELRAYAREKGVAIIGDLPMYVSADAADVWAERSLFTVDADGRSSRCAGVPPDYFAKEGQLWGNPLYDWDRMKADGYDWWMRRLARVFDLYDYVRLDHFRGFESYWSIPAGEKAAAGEWVFGPGADLFETAKEKFGPLPVLAEDLGSLTPAVRGLVDRCGFPGTDVVQFYDGDPLLGYEPPPGKAAYTGTHDNQTLLGWCGERYPDRDPAETAEKLKKIVMASRADVVILPLQDVLGLGDEARMNTPGTVGKNWAWQAKNADMKGAAAALLALTKETERS